jgi:hypothetical protein
MSSRPDQNARALAALLDTLIPPSPDGTLPGAGELGLAAIIEEAAPGFAAAAAEGLSELERRAAARGAEGFADLDLADRSALLAEYASDAPAFLPPLIFRAYAHYYQHPAVVTGLGLEARPPHPLGYELEAGDLSGLDAVRARRPLYRNV